MRRWFVTLLISLAAGISLPGHAAVLAKGTPPKDPNLRTLDSLLQQPEERIDLARAEVAIERMIDPSVDEKATLGLLDAWASRVKARLPQGEAISNDTKVGVLASTLYQPGPWNDFHPFSYDLDDELGLSIPGKLMSHYLATRKGNCVSMPVLFVILGHKLGLPITLAIAPNHVLAKYKRDNGEWMNIEATTGGTKSDSKYQEELGITPRAIATGIYLRPLSQREALLVPVDTLMQFYRENRPPEQVMPVTDAVLKVDPNNIVALLVRRDAYRRIVDDRYAKQYPTPDQMPPSMRDGYMEIYRNQVALVQKIQSLGWVPETQEHRTGYLRTVEQAKTGQQGGVR
ncbi:transglutaminase family protein [Dyella sp. ASV21]|uniref:transglutaminase family protein n=1 Tax=Dyella sp. ASV21 TaxID=2795114 RepID=UPI0018ED0BB6|nr:transglutaminase family protein [Dyella sp. ASV21]